MNLFSDPISSKALVVYNPQTDHLPKTNSEMQGMHDLFMQNSFQTQVNQCVSKSWGDVVVLVGGSSSGKSTIVNALKSFDEDMLEEGSDLTGAHFIYEFMEKNHEQFGVSNEDFEHLHTVLVPRNDHWHIHEAISLGMDAKAGAYDFKQGTPLEDQERAIKTARALHGPVCKFAENTSKMVDTIVMDKILEHAKKGYNAVFDILDIDKVLNHPISKSTLSLPTSL